MSACQDSIPEKTEPSTVTIKDQTWTVELAITRQEQYDGLSGRSDLPPDRGMLFVYSIPKIQRFCMRKCSHPLDIVFIDRDLKVINLLTMPVETNPSTNTTYTSERPALYVLEVKGGTLSKTAISAGDRVVFANIKTR